MFNLSCDTHLLELNFNKSTHLAENRSFFNIEWIHNGALINSSSNKNKLVFNKTLVKDSGLYVCIANLPLLKEKIIIDFASLVIIADNFNYEKFPGESLLIRCYGIAIKSILKESRLSIIWHKNNIEMKKEFIDWSQWKEFELSSVDGYFFKKLNFNDSGEYKCVIHDHDSNRSWATNLVKIKINDKPVNSLLTNTIFWICIISISFIFVALHLMLLLKNFFSCINLTC